MKCLICDVESKKKGNIEGYVENTYFDIYECPNCYLSFSDPHFSNGSIYNAIYKNTDKVPGYDRYFYYKEKIIKKKNPLRFLSKKEYMYKALIDYLNKLKNKDIKILEVGCGMGYLTYALNKKGYDCEGMDISINAINEAKKSFYNYKDKYTSGDFFDLTNKKYDVICMLELLEHVSNPSVFIKHAMSLLNKNGVLYLSTPQKEIKSKDFIWGVELPELHLSYFSDKSILEMCKMYKVSFLRNYFYNIFNYGIWVIDKKQELFKMNPTFNKNHELITFKNNKNKKIILKDFLLNKNKIVGTFIKNLVFSFYRNKRFNYKYNNTMAFIVENK